jgi:hypothetical protein
MYKNELRSRWLNYLLVWMMQILFSSSLISVAARWNWCSCCHFQEQRICPELGSCRVRRWGPTTKLPYTPARSAIRECALSMKDTGNPLSTATETFSKWYTDITWSAYTLRSQVRILNVTVQGEAVLQDVRKSAILRFFLLSNICFITWVADKVLLNMPRNNVCISSFLIYVS